MKNLITAILTIFLFSSCVSMKKYEEQTAISNKYLAEKKDCSESLRLTKQKLENSILEFSNASKQNQELRNTIEDLAKSTKELDKLAQEEKALRERTDKKYDQHMQNSSKNQERLLHKLSEKERILTKREADLLKLQINIEERENQFKQIKKEIFDKETNLTKTQGILNEKMIQIEELKSKIDNQNIAMSELKNNIIAALKDFNTDELTIEDKEGKIYVSLSEKLLFKPGSFVLDKNGESAIIQLATALIKQKDIDIIVEGHTDSDAFKGKSAIKDNWDLSVKRATSVVRILEKNNVPKDKIIASGRGMNKPIAENNTKDGKAKNRRTEIILSPNFEKLFKILQD